MANSQTPRASVIIPTYNRGEKILATLNSLTKQSVDRSQWEVVVVNNNSTDSTAEHLNSYSGLDNMRVVLEKNQGLSHARNCGIRESRAEILLFIDDDELVCESFIEEYLSFFDAHSDVSVAGGRYVTVYEEYKPRWVSKFIAQLLAGELHYSNTITKFKGVSSPNGGNMGVRRSAFERYGLYDVRLGRTGAQLLGGEERELVARFRKAGESIYYLPQAIIYHCIPQSRWSFEHLRKTAFMVGVTAKLRARHRGSLAYLSAIVIEAMKWIATLFLMLWYMVLFAPSRGFALVIMRWNITKGLISQ